LNQVRNYGRLLVDLAAVVPDGMVCFFVSYLYMDKASASLVLQSIYGIE
jgi:DNA excision repair protein ERCC-2